MAPTPIRPVKAGSLGEQLLQAAQRQAQLHQAIREQARQLYQLPAEPAAGGTPPPPPPAQPQK